MFQDNEFGETKSIESQPGCRKEVSGVVPNNGFDAIVFVFYKWGQAKHKVLLKRCLELKKVGKTILTSETKLLQCASQVWKSFIY